MSFSVLNYNLHYLKTVSLFAKDFFSKPLFTQKEKSNVKIIQQYPTGIYEESQLRKNLKTLQANIAILKYTHIQDTDLLHIKYSRCGLTL